MKPMNLEEYIRSLFTEEDDELLQNVLKSIEQKGMPAISVPPENGKLITLVAKIAGAKEALEIGALGGYSGIHIMRGLSEDGHLTSLELNPEYAKLAETNLTKAGFGGKVSYLLGPALESFEKLAAEGRKFDLFLIDADKKNYQNYLDYAVELANPGAIIFADNTLWRGRVYNEDEQDDMTIAMRNFNEKAAAHPELESIILPIGDGLLLSRVKA
ncbi:MAG TPA: O-methyltransferase [Bacillales bacterium]|nr:O-methyltransferase [Bacillales bacterium]